MLAAFATDPTVAINGRGLALPVAITPWRPFADSEAAASVLARVALEGGTVEQYATDAAQGRGPRYYTPLSEYLFVRLRPLAQPFVLDESEYEQLFHRTEALIALAELDWMASNTDAVNAHRRSWSRWMGRGIHHTDYYLANNSTWAMTCWERSDQNRKPGGQSRVECSAATGLVPKQQLLNTSRTRQRNASAVGKRYGKPACAQTGQQKSSAGSVSRQLNGRRDSRVAACLAVKHHRDLLFARLRTT